MTVNRLATFDPLSRSIYYNSITISKTIWAFKKDFRVLHNSNQWSNWGSYVLAIQFACGLLMVAKRAISSGTINSEIVVSNGFHFRLWNVDIMDLKTNGGWRQIFESSPPPPPPRLVLLIPKNVDTSFLVIEFWWLYPGCIHGQVWIKFSEELKTLNDTSKRTSRRMSVDIIVSYSWQNKKTKSLICLTSVKKTQWILTPETSLF